MKTKKLEKWLLLEQSGELSPRQLRRLNRELSDSEEARVLRSELRRLKGVLLTPDIEPSPWTVSQIAARLRVENRPDMALIRILKPVLALAACLALMLGIGNFHGERASSASPGVVASAGVDVWDDPIGEDLNNLENLIVAISGDSNDVMEM
ncbi:MAG TPA: hypothetical protein PKI68_06975 [Pontiellaceae bacterium]|nr:hypothetical protein [Pontiellaceae bacterium]